MFILTQIWLAVNVTPKYSRSASFTFPPHGCLPVYHLIVLQYFHIHLYFVRFSFSSSLMLLCYISFSYIMLLFINFFLHSFNLSFFTFSKISFSLPCWAFIFFAPVTICSFNISQVFPFFLHLHSRPHYAYPLGEFISFFFFFLNWEWWSNSPNYFYTHSLYAQNTPSLFFILLPLHSLPYCFVLTRLSRVCFSLTKYLLLINASERATTLTSRAFKFILHPISLIFLPFPFSDKIPESLFAHLYLTFSILPRKTTFIPSSLLFLGFYQY